MSRIHEALKRAATERSALPAGKPVTELAEPAGERLVEEVVSGATQCDVVGPGEPGIRAYKELIARCKKTEWKMQPRHSVFADEALYRHGAERFRTLRSRLYQIAATRTLKRILVTSSLPEEGKTFVASNLAQSFIRQEDKTVLLIDADLRASRLHLALGAPGTPGLSEYLRGEIDEYKIIQAGNGGNLCLIPAGAGVSNPSELLHSEKMKGLLDRLTQDR